MIDAPVSVVIGDLDGVNGPDLTVAGDDVLVLLSLCDWCPADVNGDAHVDVPDIMQVIDNRDQPGGAGDVNQDGLVDVLDLILVIVNWGSCA